MLDLVECKDVGDNDGFFELGKMNDTDNARDYLKNNLDHLFHKYIDGKLAGDFAYMLSNHIKELNFKLEQTKISLDNKTTLLISCEEKLHELKNSIDLELP